MRGLLRGIALVLLAAVPAAAAAEDEDEPHGLFGRTVASISYTCDGPADAKEIAGLVAFRVGRPMTEDDAGATVQNLFATTDFSNVLVEATALADGGVDVVIHLWRAYRVSLDFEGRAHLSHLELLRAVPLQERGPFHAGALAEGANAIERRLAADGYLHASVEPEVEFDAATFIAHVTYRVDAGQRAVFAEPFFDGSVAPYGTAALAEKLKLKAGRPYREAKARSAAERLHKFLLKDGRFRASAELIASEPVEGGAAIRPVYRIDVGPDFRIEATGIKEKTVRSEILGLLEGQSFDEDLLAQWVDTTRDDLQRKGRYRAVVEAKTEGKDPVTLRVTVQEGAKYAVERISFSGNSSVADKTLDELMVTRKKGLPLLQSGYLVEGELEKDADAILGYYQTRGWIGAHVDKPAVTEGSKPGRLDIAIKIEEGPRTYLASRQVEGAEHLSDADVNALVTQKVGEPFNPSLVRQDAAAITNRYWNTGWREAAVHDRWTLSADRTKAEVFFTVDEGIRTFFGKTIIRGNAVTEMKRVTRQVAWKEGEPYSEEKIAETQRNLSRTGVFRSIEVRPRPADPGNEEHTVDIKLSEARRISLLYGVGYQYAPGATNPNDPFATAGITYRNLFGRMQSLNLEVQYAPFSKRGYGVVNFQEPYLFGTNYPLTVAGFISREPIQQVDIDREGAFVETTRQFGFFRVGLRYSYQNIKPNDIKDLGTIALEKYPLSAFPIQQSAITPSLLYDRRDDVLDPHKGYYASMAGGYAFPFLSATAQYGKVSGQVASFWTVPGGVLAASFRAGGIYGHLQTVPIAEKFFAGGSSSARGYDTNLEGIPAILDSSGHITPESAKQLTVDYNTQATLHDPNNPVPGSQPCKFLYPVQTEQNPVLAQYDCTPGPRIVGGNGFVAIGVEYRVPIAGNFGLSLFYDLAQVWAAPGEINFHVGGDTGLTQSIGIGIHYMTPIGPLRFEYGLPVDLRTIKFQITKTPCDPTQDANQCILSPLDGGTAPSIKQTGRVFLSIGYPF